MLGRQAQLAMVTAGTICLETRGKCPESPLVGLRPDESSNHGHSVWAQFHVERTIVVVGSSGEADGQYWSVRAHSSNGRPTQLCPSLAPVLGDLAYYASVCLGQGPWAFDWTMHGSHGLVALWSLPDWIFN